ncbi:hypothetical protein BFX40_21595 [Mesorhizobium sp. SEMIA 3007]|nr:hypothetical protein A9174_22710 [Mesorhizobium loti NZP2037]ODA95206.1 hypothetical protein BFX40_21595 [Mesorhizobium sp. SEMIA 3007]
MEDVALAIGDLHLAVAAMEDYIPLLDRARKSDDAVINCGRLEARTVEPLHQPLPPHRQPVAGSTGPKGQL